MNTYLRNLWSKNYYGERNSFSMSVLLSHLDSSFYKEDEYGDVDDDNDVLEINSSL